MSYRALTIGIAALLVSPAVASEAWRWAERLKTEKEQCQMLTALCRQATAELHNAGETPPSADVLATKNAGMAKLRVDDAVSAAQVFLRKNGGRRLQCFDDPSCRFLDGRLGAGR